MPHLIAQSGAFPKHRYSQKEITKSIILSADSAHEKVFQKIHQNAGVGFRNLCLNLEEYAHLGNFGERMALWQQHSLSLASEALENLFSRKENFVSDIGHIFFTTITGISTPSIDSLLVNNFALAKDIKRTPVFGLGCLGGAALLSRACDYLLAFPKKLALVIATELCSLTWQKNDLSMANIVATGLFGDGCHALLLAGDEHPLAPLSQCKILASNQYFFANTKNIMGWDILDSGFKIVLSPGVPELAEAELPKIIYSFLAGYNLNRSHIKHWIAHPGGPKVIAALKNGLKLNLDHFVHTKNSLYENGNMSSVSVLDVLQRTLEKKPQGLGLLMAMGPGFSAEMVLLQC